MKTILKNTRSGWTTLAVVLAAMFTIIPVYAGGPSGGGSGTSNVVVTNTPAQSVPVKDQNNGAYQPFNFFSPVKIEGAATAQYFNIPVPAGKRLVIEQASALLFIAYANGAVPYLIVSGVANGSVGGAYVVPPTSQPAVDLWAGSQAVKVYGDPGSNVTLTVTRTNDSTGNPPGYISGNVTLTGHLVDVP